MTQGAGSLNQWLVLTLESREYALPVHSVVEVLRSVAVQPLPESPAWTLGVLNLRGRGVVVMDLRTRLGLPAKAPSLSTQIVIAQAAGELLGLMADDVTEIIALPQSALRPADSLSSPSRMLSAVAHAGERLILVLDIDRLVNTSLVAAVAMGQTAGAGAAAGAGVADART